MLITQGSVVFSWSSSLSFTIYGLFVYTSGAKGHFSEIEVQNIKGGRRNASKESIFKVTFRALLNIRDCSLVPKVYTNKPLIINESELNHEIRIER